MKGDQSILTSYLFMYRTAAVSIAAVLLCLVTFPAHAGRIEAGTFIAHDTLGTNRTPDRVTFQQTFDTPPVVIVIGSSNGSNSASVRVTNVTTTGFDELIIEPDNWDGRHLQMVTYYIAVEPGRHALSGGQVIEAGLLPTSAVQFGTGFTGGIPGWANVSFTRSLNTVPTILHNLQTANSETNNPANGPSRPHITSIAQSPSLAGFQLAIDRSQANSGPFPSSETIGWIAFPNGGSGSFSDINGTSINWSAVTSAANIRGWDNGCVTNSHALTGASNPIVVAKKATRNNGDGGWLRYCSVNATTIALRVDEDRDQDNERSISTADAESAAIVAFSSSFHANLRANLAITKTHTSITNTSGSAFALPQAVVTYRITVTNSGNSPPNEDSVILTEELPPELALVLADFGAPGSGPVLFTDGSPATGLTCTFGGFTDPSDCYSFSTDGADFSYEPTDGGTGSGTDPNARFIRIEPSGFMNEAAVAGDPNFALQLRTRIR